MPAEQNDGAVCETAQLHFAVMCATSSLLSKMIAAIDASTPIDHITAYHITALVPLGGGDW